MSGFSFKPKEKGGQDSDIDFEAIAEQVEDDAHDARISLIVDLGVQKRGLGIAHEGDDAFTEVDTEEEAEELIEQAIEIMSEKFVEQNGLDEVEEEDGKFIVPFKVYQKKDAHEVAIFADLVDCVVDYGDDIGEKQYRIMLNRQWQGEITGIAMTSVPPKKKGGLWTFAPNSMPAKLANATGHPEILKDKEHNKDIGRILGEPLMITTERTNSFVNVKDIGKVPKKYLDDIEDLEGEPLGITFENATVELLESARLRKAIIEKIKKATDYAGSNMQKAIEALESSRGGSDNEEEEEQEEKPTRSKRSRKAKKEEEEVEEKKTTRKPRKAKKEEAEEEEEEKPKKKRGRPAKAKKEEVKQEDKEEEEDFDEDVPF